MVKKVVHVITGLNDGGAENVLASLCLNSTNIRHVVISLMDEGKYGSILAHSGVSIHCLGMSPGTPSLVRFFRLVKLIRAERPDVVQTWMYHADLLGGVAARLAGVDRVFWGIHQANFDRVYVKKSTLLIASICKVLSKCVPEKIICCSKNALSVHAEYGYRFSKLAVVTNGFDLSRFNPSQFSGLGVRQELGIGVSSVFVLGMVARFDCFKDHSNLLQSLRIVAQNGIDFYCLLVGNGLSPDNVSVTTKINEFGLQDNVFLLGQRKDISAVMNALDLHVLSSCSESFGNVIAEAMACGVPCVSTDVGAALDIIGDEESVCPAKDSMALAELIIAMADEWERNPGAWQVRKNVSVERIRERYSIDGMVSAYEACWFGERDRGNELCAD